MLRLLLFCIAPLPVLFLLAHIVDTGLKRSRHYFYSEWNDLYAGKINADLIIMGTSRAWVQISPKIIDSMMHLNSYNLGMDGAAFRLQYERFKIYLRHNRKPKYIIQEVGYTTLILNNSLSGPNQYLPYLNDTAVWRITQNSETPFDLADLYFPLYKYNNELPLIKEGIRSYFGKGVQSAKYKGYQGKDMAWDGLFEEFKKMHPNGHEYPIDKAAVAVFTEYLDFCKANDIKVFMVYTPVYYEALKYVIKPEEVFDILRNYSATYHIPFYDHRTDSLNYSMDNFYNSQHLNRKGSEVFSRELAQEVMKDMQQ
ncbi:MAG: hypothetical protein JWQ38_736 [Flavipsychrobacter sp.]|nr:hypothetical protein [Flavipsychrobacter sp.]